MGQTNSERGQVPPPLQNSRLPRHTDDRRPVHPVARRKSTYGTNADKVPAEYPLTAYPTPGCRPGPPSRTAASPTSYDRQQLMARLSRWVPTYAYEFAEK
ncbi:hypothetical protein ACRAWF_04360 [Streptomyces sp. L7]